MTRFPAAQDAFTNLPEETVGQPVNLRNAVANLNDAMEAVQAKLGVSLSGAPQAEVVAALSTALAGADNDLVWTSKAYGADGNAYSVEYVDPEDVDQVLAITLAGTVVTVSLATEGAGVITTTGDEIKTEVGNVTEVDDLFTVTDKAANDGSGVVTAMAAAPLTGGIDGQGRATAPAGSFLFDSASGVQYWNTGTIAEPVWTVLQAMLVKRTVSLTSAAAATPVDIILDAEVPTGWKCYLEAYVLKVDGATDWATTATIIIQDTDASPVAFVSLDASMLDGDEVHGPWTDSAIFGDAFSEQTGGTAGKGTEVVGNANGTGSTIKLTTWWRIAP